MGTKRNPRCVTAIGTAACLGEKAKDQQKIQSLHELMPGDGEGRIDWLGNALLPVHAVLCGLLMPSARKRGEKAKAEVRVADPGLHIQTRAGFLGPRLTGRGPSLEEW